MCCRAAYVLPAAAEPLVEGLPGPPPLPLPLGEDSLGLALPLPLESSGLEEDEFGLVPELDLMAACRSSFVVMTGQRVEMV